MKKRLFGLLAVITAFFLLSSCIQTIQPEDTGSLSVSITDGTKVKTLFPALDIQPAQYRIYGTGPGGTNFDINTTKSSETLDYLRFGNWNITVEAFNAAGTKIAEGNGSVVIHVEATARLDITIRLLEGNGLLDLAVNWYQNEVENPLLSAILRPGSGDDITIAFMNETAPPGLVQKSGQTALSSGYYTLIVQIHDRGDGSAPDHLAMGAVEVVRILKNQTTYGNYTLRGVPGMGKIDLNIEQEFDNPIEVFIENNASLPGSLAFDGGSRFTAIAAIPGDDEDNGSITFIWYLNGQTVGADNNFTVDMDNSPLYQNINGKYAPGHYRLDVTAFNVDGSRSGSATYEFDVTGNPAALQEQSSANKDIFLFHVGSIDGTTIVRRDVNGSGEWTNITDTQDTQNYRVSATADGLTIAFISDRTGFNEIYTMDINGSNLKRITHNTIKEADVSISPDGTRFVFQANINGRTDIYTVDSNGSNLTKMTSGGGENTWPSWSPDGSKIIYTSRRPIESTSNYDIYSVDAEGGNETFVLSQSRHDYGPKYSPDGNKIAFWSFSEETAKYKIYTADANGSNISRVTSSNLTESIPSWSPDGSKIIFIAQGQIWVVNSDGTNLEQVTNTETHVNFPIWIKR